jgi:hypothetical protein
MVQNMDGSRPHQHAGHLRHVSGNEEAAFAASFWGTGNEAWFAVGRTGSRLSAAAMLFLDAVKFRAQKNGDHGVPR